MRKTFICFFICASVFMDVSMLRAWTDDVEGVLMPEPRGGGGISGEEAESAVYGSEESNSEEPQAVIEWE